MSNLEYVFLPRFKFLAIVKKLYTLLLNNILSIEHKRIWPRHIDY
jgi:hypothetical protein